MERDGTRGTFPMSFRKNVIGYVRDLWKKGEKASMRRIQRHFNLKSPRKIYTAFPSGKQQIYRLAGVPLDKETIKQTKKAIKKKREKKVKTREVNEGEVFYYTLTKEQNRRLDGIVHLEHGKDASIILDELLERDLKFRKNKISFAKVKQLTEFLDEALPRKWTVKMLVDYMTNLWNLGIHTQSPEVVNKLIELVQILNERGWDLNEFVNYTTNYHNQLYWYGRYKRGEISKEVAIQKLKRYV